ncbi:MAG: MerR family transcriptional regulator [Acidimicrobiaceae bacterium]|nr:MerR family transcriptional regulator [Acidimicrobiaceae bacterium]
MTDGPYHSIGEVLSLLKEEHEDLTISKIRFLESQGLIEPGRTPSGYRRFYDTDIDRLRWILSQQRDNFMPLKVIKRHLDKEGFDPAAEVGERPMAQLLPEPSLFSEREMSGSLEAAEAERTATEATIEPGPAAPEAVAAMGSVSLTAGELAEASGTDLGFVGELEKLGLIAAVNSAERAVFDDEALLVAKAAAAIVARGMEVRHLRMYKVAADREAGILAQLRASALAKGGSSAAAAREDLAELVAQGDVIRRSLLRREFGLSLGG